jgi:hypothetical protein
MNWLCFNASADLARWEVRPFGATVELGPRPGDKRDNHERMVATEAPGQPEPNGPARRLADAILRFDIFPPRWLSSTLRRTPIEIGDTVGLRYRFLPGLHLFFAARVIDRFENADARQWRSGFTYRTLEGHPACGEETFIVEKDLATGNITAALRSWSRPGIWIAKLTYPIMRSLQLRAGRAALDHLELLARGAGTPNLAAGRHLRTALFGSHWL